MNIVLITAHDAGHYVQPYGIPVDTPHMMRFAREGVLFRKAFCAAPTCGPSRAAMLTGQTPHEMGMYGLPGGDGWKIDDYGKHLVNQLNRHDYETVLCGVQHEASHAEHFPEIAYQRVLEREAPAREQDGEWYPESINKLEAFLATRDDPRPFFLSVGIDEPHRDNLPRPELNLHGKSDRFTKTRFYDPEKLDWRYTAPLPWLPDLPDIRKDVESYFEGVRILDEYVGRILYALKHNGLEGNTLVILTSDHGVEFSGGKKTLSDAGTRVMLMMRGPSGSPLRGGNVIEGQVQHLDLYPTLCELLHLEVPHPLSGKSLLPLVTGQTQQLHEAVFAEQTYHGGPEPLRSVRTERYKYIRRVGDTGNRMRHDGPTATLLETLGWYDRPLGHEELFDLVLDPMEACNRAADPAYADIKAELSARLEQWMAETGDPFPSGVFPPIPATVNEPS